MNIRHFILATTLAGLTTLGVANAEPNRHEQGAHKGKHAVEKTHTKQIKKAYHKGKAHKRNIKKTKGKKRKQFYRVKRRDTLAKISRKTGVSVRALIRLNKHKIKNRRGFRLKAGQRLKLYKRNHRKNHHKHKRR